MNTAASIEPVPSASLGDESRCQGTANGYRILARGRDHSGTATGPFILARVQGHFGRQV